MEYNKKIVSLRIYVERCIERMKNWYIFDKWVFIMLVFIVSDMFIVIGVFINFLLFFIDWIKNIN